MLANIIRNRKKTGIGGGGGGIVIDGGDPYYSAVSLMLSMDGTNGSTTFTDSSLNALTVTATSATISTTQSKYGGASGYFGGSSYIVANNALLNISTGDFTVEGWIYFNSVASGQQPVSIYSGTSISFAIFTASSGTLNYYLSSNGSSWNIASGVLMGSVATSGWYHFAIVRSGSVFTPYLNGVSGTKTTSASNLNSQQQFVAGVSPNFSTGWFNGYIDDLRISRFARYVSNFTPPTAALPTTASSTVADPYYNYTSLLLHMDGADTSTNFVDSGPNALTVTATGNAQVSTTQSKYGGASAYFDGSGDYLDTSGTGIATAFGTGDFTIEFWYYPLTVSVQQNLVDKIGSASNAIYMSSAGVLKYYVGADRITGSTLSANTWYHIALIRYSGTTKLYVNGVQSGASYADTNNYALNTGSPRIGAAFNNTVSVNGYIDDLRITKYARYTSAFTPPISAHPNA